MYLDFLKIIFKEVEETQAENLKFVQKLLDINSLISIHSNVARDNIVILNKRVDLFLKTICYKLFFWLLLQTQYGPSVIFVNKIQNKH